MTNRERAQQCSTAYVPTYAVLIPPTYLCMFWPYLLMPALIPSSYACSDPTYLPMQVLTLPTYACSDPTYLCMFWPYLLMPALIPPIYTCSDPTYLPMHVLTLPTYACSDPNYRPMSVQISPTIALSDPTYLCMLCSHLPTYLRLIRWLISVPWKNALGLSAVPLIQFLLTELQTGRQVWNWKCDTVLLSISNWSKFCRYKWRFDGVTLCVASFETFQCDVLKTT